MPGINSLSPAVRLPTIPAVPVTQTAAGKGTELSAGNSGKEQVNQQVVQALVSRDREVRTHEAAHLAVAGNLARGGASFSYQQGPDGGRYAIGGEVSIDVSPVQGDPKATIKKAQIIQAAALAPAQPSGQDRAVAAAASRMAQQANSEIASGKTDNETGGSGTLSSGSTTQRRMQQTVQAVQNGGNPPTLDVYA